MTLRVVPGSMFSKVLNHVCMAPTPSDNTLPGSDNKRLESGALGFSMLSVSHPAARIRATQRPDTRGAFSIRLIVVLLTCRSAGSEVDLRKAGERPRSEEHTSELQSQSNLVC